MRASSLLCLFLLAGCHEQAKPVEPVVAEAATVGSLAQITPPDSYDGCDDCSLVVRRMAWSIDREPSLWKTDGFRLIRSDGPAVWVANEDYAISIGPTLNAMTRLSPSRSSEMKLLWRAFRRWQDAYLAMGEAASVAYGDNKK